jgi:hypothetical protein
MRETQSAVTDHAKTYYFGVMGEVSWPGVFETKSPYPRIVDILRRAGGLNNRASGSIRVVRRDRVCQQMYLSSDSPLTLLPGDLLVVDSPSRQGRLFQPISHRPVSKSAAIPGRSAYVQLAFVQLLDRPVVLKMRREQATVGRIVSLLNQPVAALRGVRLIGVPGQRGESGQSTDFNGSLADGSVLVFDTDSVQHEALPELPAAIRAVTLEDSEQPAGNASLPDTEEPGRVRIMVPNPLTAPAVEDVPSPYATEDRSDLFVNRGRLAREREAATRQPTDNEIHNKMDSDHTLASTVAGTASVLSSSKEKAPLATAENANLFGGVTATAVVLVMGGLAVTGAILMLISMARTSSTSKTKPESIPTSTPQTRRDLLDALIRDELPLTEEPLPLPASMTMFGRPNSTRRWRVDPAQRSLRDRSNEPRPDGDHVASESSPSLGGPHFRVQRASQSKRAATTRVDGEHSETASVGEAAADESGQSSTDDGDRRLLDRALTVIEQENRE